MNRKRNSKTSCKNQENVFMISSITLNEIISNQIKFICDTKQNINESSSSMLIALFRYSLILVTIGSFRTRCEGWVDNGNRYSFHSASVRRTAQRGVAVIDWGERVESYWTGVTTSCSDTTRHDNNNPYCSLRPHSSLCGPLLGHGSLCYSTIDVIERVRFILDVH